MTDIVIQLVGLASGSPTPLDGQWLVEYDPTRPGTGPDGYPLTAHIVTTPDRAKARRFNGFGEAHGVAYRAHGIRPDCQPNRPLSAFHLVFEAVSDQDPPPDNPNSGRLPDGRLWAGFCANPGCNVLGCPGDCATEP